MQNKPKELVQTQVEPELKKKLATLAKKEHLSVSSYVRRLLWDAVKSGRLAN